MLYENIDDIDKIDDTDNIDNIDEYDDVNNVIDDIENSDNLCYNFDDVDNVNYIDEIGDDILNVTNDIGHLISDLEHLNYFWCLSSYEKIQKLDWERGHKKPNIEGESMAWTHKQTKYLNIQRESAIPLFLVVVHS